MHKNRFSEKSMNVLILCGVFAPENEEELRKHARRPIEYSANIFQKKMIRGFREQGCRLTVLSAPFIGSYPNASDLRVFKGFEKKQTEYTYVPFHNTWGIRNFSRAAALKRELRSFINDGEPQKLIVVYSPHTPFLEAAVFAKQKDPGIKICLVVPDLPQYMNLDAKISWVYKVGKKVDINKFNKLNREVDSYVLLTDAMAEKLCVGKRPYFVAEGMIDADVFEKNQTAKQQVKDIASSEKYIVYTGKMNEKFGVKKLIDAFMQTDDPTYRLVLCGSGDADSYIKSKAQTDPRVTVTGQIPPETVAEWVLKADVLVNPREDNEEYTKYSFPSKTIEYLVSGNPVVGYKLGGMPACYADFMYLADTKTLFETIRYAMEDTAKNKAEKLAKAETHLKTLTGCCVAGKILSMNDVL